MNIFKLPKPDKYGRRLAGFIRTTYLLLFVCLILIGGTLIFSIVYTFDGKAAVYVQKNPKKEKAHEFGSHIIAPVKNVHLLTFSSPTISQSLLLKHKNGRADFLHYLILFSGLFQILIIFKSLDQHGFFSIEIAKHIKTLAYVYIGGWFIVGFRTIYMLFLVRDITSGQYKLDTSYFNSDFSNIFFGFILLLIAAIYKKACQLKEDQELTI